MVDLLKKLDLGVVLFDDEGRVEFANDFCFKRGVLTENPAGRKYYEVFRNVELIGLIGEMLEGSREEGRFEFGGRHYRIKRIEGERKAVQVEDVTEILRAERVQREFVATVSHELSTPLSAVGGLLETFLHSGSRELVERALRRVVELQRLIESVRLLVSLEGSNPKPGEEVNVEEILERVERDLKEEIERRGIRVVKDIREKVLIGDEEKLYILLRNLVENAVRYNREGGRVDITLRREGKGVVLEIRDTGIGIPKEDIPYLFVPFFGGKNKRGMGLGLAVSERIVKWLGGEIEIESREGVGTTVRVTFQTCNRNP